ncbi:alpha/beta hydrolase [Streptomyces sp. NPDC049881]|uniref:alpha/beta fold hydrolase n=1 Tax=unclassified Streptomyces TaxID=2593676 RepID=UPI003449C7BB
MRDIAPAHTTVDGVRVRYADSAGPGADALLLSPWPESIYAYDRVWDRLARHARLVALDLPGYGGSDLSDRYQSPEAMGAFVLRAVAALGLETPHVVAPDVGTSAVLFAAARQPDAFRSIVVGAGGVAAPVNVTGVLRSWVEESDPERYRDIDPARIVGPALGTITGYTPPAAIREDYERSYADGRFAESIRYVQEYPRQLPRLAELLPRVTAPVRVVAGEADAAVPAENSRFIGERVRGSRVDFITGAGHFCWEERPEEYARLVTEWWAAH